MTPTAPPASAACSVATCWPAALPPWWLLAAPALLPGFATPPCPHSPRARPATPKTGLGHRENTAVVAANPLATDAGYQIQGRCTSAVDAAIAGADGADLVEPQSSGIGGGAFAAQQQQGGRGLRRPRETAPAAADENSSGR